MTLQDTAECGVCVCVCSCTHQAVETVVQEDQQHSLFLQGEASFISCQHGFHHTFEEEWEMAGLLLEHLAHIKKDTELEEKGIPLTDNCRDGDLA